VVALVGPTASGKSTLAEALAEKFDGEIVSLDSAQVYCGMDIGTAKPDPATRARVPHHLIDIVSPTEAYSAARFAQDAWAAIQAITARGRLPLVVGGTLLYWRALHQGLDAMPAVDPAIRMALLAEASARGWPALHADLARIDPPTAARLAPNDRQRIERALAVFRMSGRPLSAWQSGRVAAAPFDCLLLALLPEDRALLHSRIERRFHGMVAAGLLEELRQLRARWPALDATMPAMRAVGYRQAWHHLYQGGDAAWIERGIAASRQLAKRQITWLRGLSEAIRIEPFAPVGLLESLLARVEAFVSGRTRAG
jgi:tRNA dimethylallyltransferase